MISAPGTGCCSASLASRASAGGQLEQPSEVNNSNTTGTRALAVPAAFCAGPAWQVTAKVKARAVSRKWEGFFIRNATPEIIRYYVFWFFVDEIFGSGLLS